VFFENDREIMTVQGQKSLVTNVYLTGKVFDTFDGRQWQQLSESVKKERYLDTLETLYAAERYDGRYLTDYLARTELTVTYRHFRSGYVFAPLKAWGLSEDNRSLVFSEKEGSLLVEEKRGYGSEYTVIFYQMNRNQEAFNDFLKASMEPDIELLEKLLGNLKGQTGEAFTIDDLQNHRQLVYDNYLSEVVLTERTKEYLDDITRELDSNVEKLYAIESALSSFFL